MTTEARFNKIINNLEKVIDKNKPKVELTGEQLDKQIAEMSVDAINEFLDEGRLVKIEDNKLKLI